MHNVLVDECARAIGLVCLPLVNLASDSKLKEPNIEDTRCIVERWLSAPGWGDEPFDRRADALVQFIQHFVHLMKGEHLPLEWLLFPAIASVSLQEQADETDDPDERARNLCCVQELRSFASVLQNAANVPTYCLTVTNDHLQ